MKRLRQTHEDKISEAQAELREFQREARGTSLLRPAPLPRKYILSLIVQKLTSRLISSGSSEERIQATENRDHSYERCEEALKLLSSGKEEFEDQVNLQMSQSLLGNAPY